MSVDVLIVKTHGNAITLKELRTLIPRYSSHSILRTEEVGLRCTPLSIIAIIDLVPSEVVIDTQCTAGLVVVVLDSQAGSTTRNPLVVLQLGLRYCTGIRGIPMGQVQIHSSIPMFTDVVAQLHVAPILLEAHVGTMVIRTTVLCGNGR